MLQLQAWLRPPPPPAVKSARSSSTLRCQTMPTSPTRSLDWDGCLLQSSRTLDWAGLGRTIHKLLTMGQADYSQTTVRQGLPSLGHFTSTWKSHIPMATVSRRLVPMYKFPWNTIPQDFDGVLEEISIEHWIPYDLRMSLEVENNAIFDNRYNPITQHYTWHTYNAIHEQPVQQPTFWTQIYRREETMPKQYGYHTSLSTQTPLQYI